MVKACEQSWDELYTGLFEVEIEGWRITIFNDCNELDYCEECIRDDGRHWAFDCNQADPVDLLNPSEQALLLNLLREL